MRLAARAVLSLLCVSLCGALVQSGPIIPNQSRIIGTVVAYTILSSEFIGVVPHQTLYQLGVLIESSEGVSAYPDLLANSEGEVVEMVSKHELNPCLYGRIIQAEVRMSGDEFGQRTWLLPGTLKVLGPNPSIQTPSFCIEQRFESWRSSNVSQFRPGGRCPCGVVYRSAEGEFGGATGHVRTERLAPSWASALF
ncbi:hypothetical protein ACFLS5_02525 [Candidatus Bipolaricaulota bacterium]